MLDFTDTDKNCSKMTMDKVQLGLPSCLTNNLEDFETKIENRVNRARGNKKNILCDTLYETFGECWTIEFPSCFTEREITFIKDEIDSTVKTIFDAFVKSPVIDVVKCLQQGSSASSTHPPSFDLEVYTSESTVSSRDMSKSKSSHSQSLHIGLICFLLGTFLLPRTNI